MTPCKHCGCTADNPCRLPNGDECSRALGGKRCTAPPCELADLAMRRREYYRDVRRAVAQALARKQYARGKRASRMRRAA